MGSNWAIMGSYKKLILLTWRLCSALQSWQIARNLPSFLGENKDSPLNSPDCNLRIKLNAVVTWEVRLEFFLTCAESLRFGGNER